jgi:hypothetical protein
VVPPFAPVTTKSMEETFAGTVKGCGAPVHPNVSVYEVPAGEATPGVSPTSPAANEKAPNGIQEILATSTSLTPSGPTLSPGVQEIKRNVS